MDWTILFSIHVSYCDCHFTFVKQNGEKTDKVIFESGARIENSEKKFFSRQITRKWATLANPLVVSELNYFSLITHHFSLLKDICFRVQKTVFRVAKDRLLEGKTLCFATRNIYLSEWKGSEGGVKGELKREKMTIFRFFRAKILTEIRLTLFCEKC